MYLVLQKSIFLWLSVLKMRAVVVSANFTLNISLLCVRGCSLFIWKFALLAPTTSAICAPCNRLHARAEQVAYPSPRQALPFLPLLYIKCSLALRVCEQKKCSLWLWPEFECFKLNEEKKDFVCFPLALGCLFSANLIWRRFDS